MAKCDFSCVCVACVFSCNFAADFRTPFYKNTSGGLLLIILRAASDYSLQSFNDVFKLLLSTNTKTNC